ncbi:MAG: hypothetical protein IH830_05475 [Planctomycetes bacterium]|nr:hypothetical protein [Planctomycetota bacterium]
MNHRSKMRLCYCTGGGLLIAAASAVGLTIMALGANRPVVVGPAEALTDSGVWQSARPQLSDRLAFEGGVATGPFCPTPVYDNGTYDLVNGGRPTAGWTEAGVIDDFETTVPIGFSCVQVAMLDNTGQTDLQTMRVQIFDLNDIDGLGGGDGTIPGVGSFAAAISVCDNTYSVGAGTMTLTDTLDDAFGFDVILFDAIGAKCDLPPGDYGFHLTFPGSGAVDFWTTATPTGASPDCAHVWGTVVDLPSDFCAPLGPAFLSMHFNLSQGEAGACGDGVCDPVENPCNCPADCGNPPLDEVGLCDDGIDNDCDGNIDCVDSDCANDPVCVPPQTDNLCADRRPVFNGKTDFDNTGATYDGLLDPVGDPCPNVNATGDVWFNYTADADGTVDIDTCQSAGITDTVLSVYDGCDCGILSCDINGLPGGLLATNDDSGLCGAGSFLSAVKIPVVAGNCYKIQVSGWQGEEGAGVLTIAKQPPPKGQTDNLCADRRPVFNGKTDFDNTGATLDGPVCDPDQTGDVWFNYFPDETTSVDIDTCQSTGLTDTVLNVYDGCDCGTIHCDPDGLPGQLLATNDDSGLCGAGSFLSAVKIPVVAGNCYKIQVSGWQGEEGAGTLTITKQPPPQIGACCIWDGTCVDNSTADDCAAVGGIFGGVGSVCLGDADGDGVDDLCAPILPQGANFFTDPDAFAAALAGTDKRAKAAWAFKPHKLPPADVVALDDPLNINTHFLDPDSPWFNPPPPPPCAQVPGEPLNNCCSRRETVGNGKTPFDNTAATLDGPVCNPNQTGDVWFNYIAPESGSVDIDTCQSVGLVDTVLNVYDGCDCTTIHCDPDGLPGQLLATNDDSDLCGAGSFLSAVKIPVVAGDCYKIQVSGWKGDAGAGVLTITKQGAPECLGDDCADGSIEVCPGGIPDCFCFTAFAGGPQCAGSIGCAGITLCPTGTECPAGFVCVVDTCCGPEAVCVPVGCTVPLAPLPPGTLTATGIVGGRADMGDFGQGGGVAGEGGEDLWPPSLDNVTFQSNTLGLQAPLPSPAGPGGLAFASAGFLDIPNNILVSNTFVNGFDIISGPPVVPPDNHTAMSLEIISALGGVGPIFVTVFDKNEESIGKIKLENPAPPPNGDQCVDRKPIENGQTPFTTVGASSDGPAPCGLLGSDIWFNYTPLEDASVDIDTCRNTDFDTVLAVYKGCACPVGAPIACNDDTCGLQSSVKIDVLANNCYKIQLGGFNGAQGTGTLTITKQGPPPPCEQLPGAPFNDCCDRRSPIFNGPTPFTNISAITDGVDHGAGFCGPFGDGSVHNDIWYNYNADFTGTLQITTCEELGGAADYDTRIAAYDGCDVAACPPSATVLGCNDDDPVNPCGTGAGGFHSTLAIPVVAGNCYKIRLGGFAEGDVGTGTLQLNKNPPPGVVGGQAAMGAFRGDKAAAKKAAKLGALTDRIGKGGVAGVTRKLFLGIITKPGVTIGRVNIYDTTDGAEGLTKIIVYTDESQEPFNNADISSPGFPGVPDGCVDATDLATILGAWCSAAGDPDPPGDVDPPCEDCNAANFLIADINGPDGAPDGCVDPFDLAKLFAAWCSVSGGNPCGTCFP